MPPRVASTASARHIWRRFRRYGRGSAAVEFALAAPVFFALLFAIIDMGVMFFASQQPRWSRRYRYRQAVLLMAAIRQRAWLQHREFVGRQAIAGGDGCILQRALLEQSDEIIAADMASRAALRRQSDEGSPRHRSDRVRVYRADHARNVFRDDGVFFPPIVRRCDSGRTQGANIASLKSNCIAQIKRPR
jgi:TadE-like protein